MEPDEFLFHSDNRDSNGLPSNVKYIWIGFMNTDTTKLNFLALKIYEAGNNTPLEYGTSADIIKYVEFNLWQGEAASVLFGKNTYELRNNTDFHIRESNEEYVIFKLNELKT